MAMQVWHLENSDRGGQASGIERIKEQKDNEQREIIFFPCLLGSPTKFNM